MFALISTVETVSNNDVVLGNRVLEILSNTFPVHESLFWIDIGDIVPNTKGTLYFSNDQIQVLVNKPNLRFVESNTVIEMTEVSL